MANVIKMYTYTLYSLTLLIKIVWYFSNYIFNKGPFCVSGRAAPGAA